MVRPVAVSERVLRYRQNIYNADKTVNINVLRSRCFLFLLRIFKLLGVRISDYYYRPWK